MSHIFRDDYKQVKCTYENYVKELRQEDSLIKARLGWFLLFEGLLFNMYTQATREIRQLILVLGAMIAVLVLMSLIAAVCVWFHNFKIITVDFVERFHITEEDRINFPQLNRDKKFIWLGHAFALFIPTVIIGVWIFIYVYIL
ncbi:hypothetical protein MKJ04_11880 [Pontibacter sp. E15-1]|uniref:hypothetical protein n=1 Tax=Pontibacter sp. E15-1 TaxID=2919918 RepID=UPI001F4FE35A|nr:hypothetical protein [Pontibacter sp. E15-1]MCJ8165540.1 hypothetical protein [Pontibacter sp. E15-1]